MGEALAPFASTPPAPADTRVVDGVQPAGAAMQVSRRKISVTPLASPRTKLFASEANATNRPLVLSEGERLAPLASAPLKPTEIRIVAGVHPDVTP